MVSNSYDRKKGSRFIARIFAVLALALVTVVIVAVVSNSLGGSTTSTPTARVKPSHPKPPPDDCYIVKTGDSVSQIVANEGVPEQRLKNLNAGRINLNLPLQAGMAMNIVPDGCKNFAAGG